MLSHILKSFQLKEREIELFLVVLELGAQPASTIARRCERPRNTVRSILDSLVQRGLMVKTMRAHTQYYAAETKDNLLRALKFRKLTLERELDEQVRLLEDYGHELTDRRWATTRPRIRYYEGWSGLEKLHEDTLSADRLKSWCSYDSIMHARPEYFRSYFQRRTAKGIPIRAIFPDVPEARAAQARDALELRESALVPADRFNWAPEIEMYGDKVLISSWREKLGIVIESREIAQAMEAFFDLSYEAAQQYGKATRLPGEVRAKFEDVSKEGIIEERMEKESTFALAEKS